MRDRFLDLLQRLSEAHGGAAAEGRVRDCLRAELDAPGTADKTGNLCFHAKGQAERPVVMLAAHMDEVGLAVHSITPEGYLRLVPMGGFWRPVLMAQRFNVLNRNGESITGVIASKPVHMLSDAEKKGCPEIESMVLDVGARSARQASDDFHIRPGDPIVPDAPFTPMRNPDRMLGKAFDDRAGLAVGTWAFQSLAGAHPNTVCLAATVQEEIGCRGAQTVCESVKPDVCLILEGAPADDGPGSSPDNHQGALGHGVQLRVLDPSAVMNRALVDLVLDTAAENNIPCQTAVRRNGGTDAGKIHLAGEGVPCVVLGIPARYIHTPHCVVDINDCLGAISLLHAAIRKLDEPTVRRLTAF